MKRLVRTLVLTLTAATSLTACSSANITGVQMSRSYQEGTPVQRTTTFAPSDTFHAVVELANAPDGTTQRAVLTAVDVANVRDKKVTEVTITHGSGTIDNTFTLPNPWPAGAYKVDVYLNGQLSKTVAFKVLSDGTDGGTPAPSSTADTPAPT